MWFDGIRQPNTLYVASVSRGKDSTAMLRAIQLMGWPLDGIASVDIWFDKDTPAELPPMVAFKDEWDAKCEAWFGVPVMRLCARKKEPKDKESHTKGCHTVTCSTNENKRTMENIARGSPARCTDGANGSKTQPTDETDSMLTYTDIFYRKVSPQRERVCRPDHPKIGDNQLRGFPMVGGAWCNSDLKRAAIRISNVKRKLVYRAQDECNTIKGFPWRKGAWRQDRLKGNNLDSFPSSPRTTGER